MDFAEKALPNLMKDGIFPVFIASILYVVTVGVSATAKNIRELFNLS